MRRNDAKEAFSFLERSRARNFQDRLQTQTGAQTKGSESQGPALTLARTQTNIPAETALLEYWSSGDQVGPGLVHAEQVCECRRRNYLRPSSRIFCTVLDGMPDKDLGGNWHDQIRIFYSLLPDDPTFFEGIRHLLIVPDGWISYIPFLTWSLVAETQVRP